MGARRKAITADELVLASDFSPARIIPELTRLANEGVIVLDGDSENIGPSTEITMPVRQRHRVARNESSHKPSKAAHQRFRNGWQPLASLAHDDRFPAACVKPTCRARNASVELACGKGMSGIGTSRKRQIGAQPSATLTVSSRSGAIVRCTSAM
jgi:hypothetical protein